MDDLELGAPFSTGRAIVGRRVKNRAKSEGFLSDIKALPGPTDWDRFCEACEIFQSYCALSAHADGLASGDVDDGDGDDAIAITGEEACNTDAWGTALVRYFESKVLDKLEIGDGRRKYDGTSLNNWLRHDTALIRELYFPSEREMFGTRDDPQPKGSGAGGYYHRKVPGPVRVAVEIRAWGNNIYLDLGILEHPARSLPGTKTDLLGFEPLANEYVRTSIVDEEERARRDPRCKIKGRWYVVSTLLLDDCTPDRLEEELEGLLTEMRGIRDVYDSCPYANRDERFVKIKADGRPGSFKPNPLDADPTSTTTTTTTTTAATGKMGLPAFELSLAGNKVGMNGVPYTPYSLGAKIPKRPVGRPPSQPKPQPPQRVEASVQTEGTVVVLMPGERIVKDSLNTNNNTNNSNSNHPVDWDAGILLNDSLLPTFHPPALFSMKRESPSSPGDSAGGRVRKRKKMFGED
jgi:hypothetical protein